MFGVVEALLLKSKVILYYIEPQLPSNVFNYSNLWMIGIKILRKKGGVHLVNICCNRAPMMGSIRYITNHSSMISSFQDVIPQNMMHSLTMDVLRCNIRKILDNPDGDERLPLNIIVLRCSGGDGLLKAMMSKEVAGFKQAMYEFGKVSKDLIKGANEGNRHWYPGVIWSVVQDNVPDSFGIDTGNGQLRDSDKALWTLQ